MKNIRIAILASGTGSNAQALIDYFSSNDFIHVESLVSNNENCGAVKIAHEHQIALGVFSNEQFEAGEAVQAFLLDKKIDFIILAGFLRKIPRSIIQHYRKRILNIHPSILPAFGGAGLYGNRVHEAVLAAKKDHSGITIHLVNEHYDEGSYIAQFYTSVAADETVASLGTKIHQLEHRYLPFVVEGYIQSNF